MYVALYSNLKSWVMAQSESPSAAKKFGTLVFEGFVPAEFFPTDILKRLNSDIERDGFARVSEGLADVLISECYDRYGKMIRAIEPSSIDSKTTQSDRHEKGPLLAAFRNDLW